MVLIGSSRRSSPFSALYRGILAILHLPMVGLRWMRRHGVLRILLWTSAGVTLLIVLWLLWLFVTLPDISDPRTFTADQSTIILDRKGREVSRIFAAEDRRWIESAQIPQVMRDAIVSIEDKRFYEHGCIDTRGILRALWVNLTGTSRQGASTITQQLARNAILTLERTYTRKIREVMIACALEQRYSKEELLAYYLNWVPFGPNTYGIELASQRYFGISAKDLTLPQAAILASIPQRPPYYNPHGQHVRTTLTSAGLARLERGEIKSADDLQSTDFSTGLLGQAVGTGATALYVGGRADEVLRVMEEQGKITAAEHRTAQQALTTIAFQSAPSTAESPYFTLAVRELLDTLLGADREAGFLEQGGLTVETTIDLDLQRAAEGLIARKREGVLTSAGAHNIALLAVDSASGGVLAYVGNANYNDSEHAGRFDMVPAPRQPGSSFKPLVYAAAFQNGASPATILYDVPTKLGSYQPQNFDGQFWGLMNIRHALAASRNIPAIKAYYLAGEEENILSLAAQMGAPTPQRLRPAEGYGPALAIGSAETPLSEMVQIYSTFANAGTAVPLHMIERITDKRGNILYDASSLKSVQVLDPRIAYQITSILSDVAARPNAFWQQVLTVPGTEAAAKTGTSNKCLATSPAGVCTNRKPSDLWTIGYTPTITAGVWVGNTDSSPLFSSAEALSTAAPLWKDFMVETQRIVPGSSKAFPMPKGIVQAQISLLSGDLPSDCTPVDSRAPEIFLEDRAPTTTDSGCKDLVIDRVTGLLASAECPVEATQTGAFLVLRGVLETRFPQWQQSLHDWAQGRMQGYDPATNTFASGSALPLPLAPTETCRLALTPGRNIRPTLQIVAPEEGGRVSSPAFRPVLAIGHGSQIREVRATIDSRTVTVEASDPARPLIRVPRSIDPRGSHVLTVTIVDTYFNAATATVRFTFGADDTGPSVRILSPLDGAQITLGENLSITAEATDSESGIKYVEFFLDDTLLTTKPAPPFTLTYALTSGAHTIRAVATDLAGNTGQDQVSLTVGSGLQVVPRE